MATPERKDDWETIVRAEVDRLLSEGKGDLRILITGRTGAGKSALVNSIVGEYVAEEGDSPYGETIKVTKYEKKIGAVTVTIYDSPGLQDGINDKKIEDQYLKDLEENCREVDLNLYCVKMNDQMRPRESDAITKLSCAFGMEEFWQSTLFVLTFANEIELPNNSSSTLVDHFDKEISGWKTRLQGTLVDNTGITKEVAESVPVVPAGYSDEPSLPAANYDYWLSNLWFECLDRTEDIAKPILLNINWGRLKPSEEVKKEDIPKKKGFEQPIIKDVTKPHALESFFKELSLKDTTGSGQSTSTSQDQRKQITKLGASPTLGELQVLRKGKKKKIRIIQKVAAKWMELGDMLAVKTLDNIKEENQGVPNQCCREMFRRWIRGEGVKPPSWEKLIEAIDKNGEIGLAEDITKALS